MKKLLTLFALASLVLTACDKEEQWTQVVLNDDELTSATISPSGDPKSIRISGGSGDYSVVIDEPSVADVSIEPSYGAGILLVIEPKAEGEAVVTVTDTKSGLFARCQLKVATYTTSFEITAISLDIDTENTEAFGVIRADMMADKMAPPVGGAILRGYLRAPVDVWMFVDAEGEEVSRGTLIQDEITEWNPAFDFLPVNSQIMDSYKCIFSRDDETVREYDVVLCRGKFSFTRANVSPSFNYHYRFYQDLTEYYKAKFPDAGVRNVARVLISNPPTLE